MNKLGIAMCSCEEMNLQELCSVRNPCLKRQTGKQIEDTQHCLLAFTCTYIDEHTCLCTRVCTQKAKKDSAGNNTKADPWFTHTCASTCTPTHTRVYKQCCFLRNTYRTLQPPCISWEFPKLDTDRAHDKIKRGVNGTHLRLCLLFTEERKQEGRTNLDVTGDVRQKTQGFSQLGNANDG